MGKEKILTKVVEQLDKLGHIPDLFLKGALAYAGFRATGNIGGAITALVGLRLAEGHNLAGGAAGVTALALIGLGNAFPAMSEDLLATLPEGMSIQEFIKASRWP